MGDLLFWEGLKFSSVSLALLVKKSFVVELAVSQMNFCYGNPEKTITALQAGEVIKFILQGSLMRLFGYKMMCLWNHCGKPAPAVIGGFM